MNSEETGLIDFLCFALDSRNGQNSVLYIEESSFFLSQIAWNRAKQCFLYRRSEQFCLRTFEETGLIDFLCSAQTLERIGIGQKRVFCIEDRNRTISSQNQRLTFEETGLIDFLCFAQTLVRIGTGKNVFSV